MSQLKNFKSFFVYIKQSWKFQNQHLYYNLTCENQINLGYSTLTNQYKQILCSKIMILSISNFDKRKHAKIIVSHYPQILHGQTKITAAEYINASITVHCYLYLSFSFQTPYLLVIHFLILISTQTSSTDTCETRWIDLL